METVKQSVILFVDAETDGLWGLPFAVGAVVYNESGVEIARYVGRSNVQPTNQWVRENVLPNIQDVPDVGGGTDTLLSDFADFYSSMRDQYDVTVLWHMGHVVEAYLFRLLVEKGFIGEWDAPYVPIEVSAYLQQAGYKPDSVDGYMSANGLSAEYDGATHNPLYDCIASYRVWEHLTRK